MSQSPDTARARCTMQRQALLLLLLGFLTACGFSLRTADSGQLQIRELTVNSSLSTELTEAITGQLEEAGVDTGSVSDSALRLRLNEEERSQRALSVNTRARGAEYEIELSISASLYLGESLLAGPETFTARQLHDQDPANISTSDRELQSVHDALYRQISAQLIRRLAAIDPGQLATTNGP